MYLKIILKTEQIENICGNFFVTIINKVRRVRIFQF